MAVSSDPLEELIEEAIFRYSPSSVRPPWTSSEKQTICNLVAAPVQPNQMTRREEEGLIDGDATPPLRHLPPLMSPEKSGNEEEGEDGPDLAEETQPPTPSLHRGRRQDSKT
jgi:hypothetical protein